MFALPHARRGLFVAAAGAFAVGLAACAPVHTPPQQIEADPPKVSYTYDSDSDLMAANDKAQTYCEQYQAVPSMDGTIAANADGTRTVTFHCVPSRAAAPPPSPRPMSYTYRSDGELLRALQAAESYCSQQGQAVSSSIETNPDGSKSLSFRCVSA